MAPLTAIHRSAVPPSGASLAVSCTLAPPPPSPSSSSNGRRTRTGHLVTARNNVVRVYEVVEHANMQHQTTSSSSSSSPHYVLSHLLTRRLPGTITAIEAVKTLSTKRDGCERLLIAFEWAKMSLMEWSEEAHDLVPVSLHTFEKLPQVDDSRPTLLAVDPTPPIATSTSGSTSTSLTRLAALLLPTNTGGDGTLALLPFFGEELDWEGLGLQDARVADDSEELGIPYAPSHLVPLAALTASSSHATSSLTSAARSSTLPSASTSIASNAFSTTSTGPPPIRNVASMSFLPGFTEPTLAILYAPEQSWAGRVEHLQTNFLVSLVTLSPALKRDPADKGEQDSAPTRAVVISTSPSIPYTALSLHPTPYPSALPLGGTLVLTANSILHVDQSGRMVGVKANHWASRDWPSPATARKPSGLDDDTRLDPSLGAQGEGLEGATLEFLSPLSPASDSSEGGDAPRALVWCRSGAVLQLSFSLTGRAVSSLKLEKLADAGHVAGGGSSVLRRLEGPGGERQEREGAVFVGSETGASAVVCWTRGGRRRRVEVGGRKKHEEANQRRDGDGVVDRMELEDEDDIYGDSTSTSSAPAPPQQTAISLPSFRKLPSSAAASSIATASDGTIRLEVCDTVQGYGAVRALVSGLVDDESPAEIVAATGAGETAGLTIFRRQIYPTSRRALHLPSSVAPPSDPALEPAAFVPTAGLWRLKLAPRAMGDAAGMEEVWVGSDKERTLFYRPFPGSTPATTAALQLVHEEPDVSALAAFAMAGGRVVVTVSREAINVCDQDLNALQNLALPVPLHAVAHHPHLTSTSSYLVIHAPSTATGGARARTTPFIYHLDPSTLQLLPLDSVLSSNETDDTRLGKRAAVFRDDFELVPLARPAPKKVKKQVNGGVVALDAMEEDEEDLYGGSTKTDTKANEVNGTSEAAPGGEVERDRIVWPQEMGGEAQDRCEWLAEVDAKGDLKIRLLPSGTEIFASSAVTLLPEVIEDGVADRMIADNIDQDDVKVERVFVANVGRNGREKVHLMILLTSGQLAVYEAFPSLSAVPDSFAPPSDSSAPPPARLAARFVKTLVRHLPSAPLRRKGAAAASDLPSPRRDFLPFASIGGHAGVFLSGEEAFWLLKGDHGPARCFESADRGVYGVVELGGGQQRDERGGPVERDELALQTREGLSIARLPPALSLDTVIPYTTIPKDRVYGHLAFDLDSGMYVGATLHQTRFVAFDEEGHPLWKEQATDLLEPMNYRSTLELLVPGSWQAIHGHEFRQNEFVTSMKSVSLASKSTRTGTRDFIAVGTAVHRAEDLATRGGIYVFEVVRINPHPATPHFDYQLRLLFFEDAKAAVNNVCDLNGYLFLSMGQKLYARAFEQDEFLLAVGFLDVGVHVTSLTALKNFLLIGDEQQSISLVAFQEDPYKLVMLGRDYRPSRVQGSNFIVNEGKVAFVSNDDKGVLRLFEYDPTNIASHAGQRLMCRTEYHAGTESIASTLFAKHLPNEDAKQNGILYGGLDGSLFTLVPVRDAVFRRLQSLQALMSRHVLHFGGLNPRAYRIVKNDSVSRAIVKGILDGDLLAAFEMLPLERQVELAEAVGTDADTVLANLRNLKGIE
ncbi:cleavage and polyadenylation specificity factor subunit 1 [Rhodotorula toruloides]|uniref:Cleavage and polyadenylation specificity factor subunit 1 n=1 Tax=Rhodotorula toruloides TaxID=5286 RepID=A0A511KR66_RHOTO|nr:cleavage and polyadenylation specificity factor subunit 1 [Rhodotorula toruloides]